MKLFVFCVLLLLSSIFTDAVNQIKYPGCGKGVPKEMIDEFEKLEDFGGSSSRANGMSSRATNMKPVKSRPAFLVTLEFLTENGHSWQEMGTLITNMHILTRFKDPSETVTSITAIMNNHWGETQIKATSYEQTDIFSTSTNEKNVSMAVVALPKGKSFKGGIPICLPMAKVEIKGIRGQVASTGKKHFGDFSVNPACMTNGIGFSKFIKCATGCMRMAPVDQGRKKCKEMMMVARNLMETRYYMVRPDGEDFFDVMKMERGSDQFTCYSEKVLRESPTLCLDINRDWGFCSPACEDVDDKKNDGITFSNQVIVEEWEFLDGEDGNMVKMFSANTTMLAPLTITMSDVNWDIEVIKREKVTPPPGYVTFGDGDNGSPFWTYTRDPHGNHVAQLIGMVANSEMKDLSYINIATDEVLGWLHRRVDDEHLYYEL